MKVGDMVRLSSSKTRKGFDYENMVGLIVSMSRLPTLECVVCSVNFGGEVYDLNVTDLDVIKTGEV